MRQPYGTDLTDAGWDHLRYGVFAGHEIPPDLREVVDALLYRDQAWCPWSLLPPGFLPVDRLREYRRAWGADGTWARIREAARSSRTNRPRSPGSWIGRARQTTARGARKLPRGGALLWPGRAVIKTAEYILSRFTIHAWLPGWFSRAHQFMAAGEYAAAAELYTRILAIDPANVPSLLRRAWAYHQLARNAEACADCWTALALPDLTLADRAQAHFYLSQSRVLLGEAAQGAEHGALARLFHRYGPDAPWDTDEAVVGPDEFELLADTHNDLAEYAINTRADFPTATALYQLGAEVRRRYARWLAEVPSRTLYLSEDWVRNIGHMALIDFWVKMDRMGWRTWDRMVLLAPPGRTANRTYAEYYAPFFRILRTDQVPPGLRHLVTTFGPRVASLLDLPDGSSRYFLEGMGLIQEAWERDGRDPLLRITPEDEAFGRAQLRAMGVPDGAWFVSLHVRSPGFHKEGAVTHQSHRNADVRSYLTAIREIVRQGGWVIRLGDPSMPPLPRMEGVVDYARSRFKSARMDVFLCAGCRFYVGVASGISHLPTTFGVPCVLTNWLSNVLPVYSRNDLFLPKLLRTTRDGRLLPFERYLDPATRLLSYSGDNLAAAGLVPVDNTPDELRDAVVEMMDQLAGTGAFAPKDEETVATFDTLARAAGLAGFPRVSRSFMARHQALLSPSPALGLAGKAA
ncbi:MAG: repeat:TPR repeat [Gemmataceae bacterium]|nr:repeat:TPR repeat [Gemmataceae bacterium]